MEKKSQPHHHHHHHQQRRRGGGRIVIPHSSSSSSRYPLSHEFLSNNPSKIDRNNNTTGSRNSNDDDNQEDLPAIAGTCPFMCPVEERARRERLRDLAVFERLDGNPGKTSSSLAVKKDVGASDVRPLPVLEDTLNYLFNLLNSREYPFEVVHDFIFDRTRSIRQDLAMQNIISDKAVLMYERMVKFHVISHHKLQRHSGSPDISPMHHLNMEQLTKALSSLYNLYDANQNSHSISENEAEFRSFYVLLHLGSENQPMVYLLHSLLYFRLGNYKRFMSTIEAEASYLQYCIIEPYIIEVRTLALCCVNYGGYKLHPYPLADLSKLLLMKSSGNSCRQGQSGSFGSPRQSLKMSSINEKKNGTAVVKWGLRRLSKRLQNRQATPAAATKEDIWLKKRNEELERELELNVEREEQEFIQELQRKWEKERTAIEAAMEEELNSEGLLQTIDRN
ncbi:hypothetical protein LguiB_024085 [Lonicera macranthoides]